MAKSGYIPSNGEKQLNNSNPYVYGAIVYETTRSGTTVTYNIGAKFWVKSGWRNDRWACQFTINGTAQNSNITVKPKTSGNLPTTPYWPIDSNPASGNYYNGNIIHYVHTGTTEVPIGTNTMKIKVLLRNTGGGSSWSGSDQYHYDIGTIEGDAELDVGSVPVKGYIRNEDIYGDWGEYWECYNQNMVPGASINFSYYDNSAEYQSVSYAGTVGNSGTTFHLDAYKKQYNLDLNGYLDGSNSGWIGGYGTCNITFNDRSASAVNVNDYNTAHRYGTHYTFSNIQEVIGHTYKGLKSGSKPLEGDITDTTDVRLSFVTNDFYAKDSGTYKPGNVYVKQNGSWTRVRRDGNNTSGFNSLCYIKQNGSWQRIDG